ncbi:MAG: ACT domain-containing protein [Chloroflexi bacterium]|nr:ACT domain-containing protein [Chloroflexota bacterium]
MAERPKIKVGGILRYRDLCLVGVMSAPDRPGLAAAIFRALGESGLNCQFIVQSIDLNNDSHVQFCVAAEDRSRVLEILEPIRQTLGARKVIARWPVAILGVFGPDFRERPGIAGLGFGALSAAGINILAVSTSISTISCVIEQEGYDRALEALQSVFALP